MATDWSSVVGDLIAEQSRPDRIYQKTLYIAVTHPVWIQQLQFMKMEIIRSVNRYHGKEWIDEVKFFVDGGGGGGFRRDGGGQVQGFGRKY